MFSFEDTLGLGVILLVLVFCGIQFKTMVDSTPEMKKGIESIVLSR